MFNINFFQRNGQRPRFSQTYRGLDKGEIEQRRIRYIYSKIKMTAYLVF